MTEVTVAYQSGTTATGGAITSLVSEANPLPVAASTTIAPGSTFEVQGFGTAGTAIGGVLSVQGEAGMTPVVTSGTVVVSGGTIAVSGAPALRVLTVAQLPGTITISGTFQAALAPNAVRAGGIVVNNGTATQFVYLGAHGSATMAAAIPLGIDKGLALDLGTPDGVYRGEVAIAGTTGDKFATVENT